MTCPRCHGLIVQERVNPFDWWLRCVNCGNREDRVILRNRAEQAVAGAMHIEAEQRDLKEWAAWLAPAARSA